MSDDAADNFWRPDVHISAANFFGVRPCGLPQLPHPRFGRVVPQPPHPLGQQAHSARSVAALPVLISHGDLDESPQEFATRTDCPPPDLLPFLVGFKKVSGVEQAGAGKQVRVFFGVR